MNKLKKPDDEVKDVFNECIGNIRDDKLKAKLENCLNDIILNTKNYEQKMENGQVHTIPIHTELNGLTKEQMVKLYDDKMAKAGQPGRKYYDKLVSIPEYGICPYCGQGIVSTLDHYLPKTKFVSLVVTPSNLIPACFDCNKAKTSSDFKGFEDTMINPYFDDLGKEIWLKAKVVKEKENDFVITYYAQKPESWSNELFKRVENHFKAFHLNRLYSSHSAQKLRGVKPKLIKRYREFGIDLVLEYLKDGLDEYSYDLNCWQSALFSELLGNSWIHEEWLEMHKEGVVY
jgi:5-methylcytosine-specific restriction endonuclease McrA